MTNISKISITIILGSSVLYANTNIMKKYDVKSAKVDYSIKESGNIMGMVQIKSIGKKRVIFDNYGVKELTEESKVKKKTTNGQTKVDKIHTIQYMNDGIIYSVNFNKKTIIRMENRVKSMATMFSSGKDIGQTNESMMKNIGGERIGTDKVLGYTCDVWNLMGIKQCLYKGIPLRIESNIMGLKSLQIATKAEFNIVLDENDFKLPEYQIVDIEGNKLNLDRDKLNEIDQKESNENSKKMQDGMKAMVAAMGALKESGFDMNNPNAKPTKVQTKAMQQAAMSAMGGEEQMLINTKKEILDESKNLPEIKKCFQNANTVKEANICEKKADMEDPEHHAKWNENIKAKVIKEITNFEKSLPCLMKASSFAALKQCMP